MRILTLNCQKNYCSEKLPGFLKNLLEGTDYDFMLLQEATNEVLKMIELTSGNYQCLSVFNSEINIQSELCILYRKEFKLLDNNFYSFVKFHPMNLHRAEFGLLIGKFSTKNGNITVGTIHANPGAHFLSRMREMHFIKECLLKHNEGNMPIVFGGDFNSGPFEPYRNDNLLKPEFINCTKYSGHTWEGMYCEPIVFLNRLAIKLAKAGLNVKLTPDHIYANQTLLKDKKHFSRVLPDRVSDHSPVEITL